VDLRIEDRKVIPERNLSGVTMKISLTSLVSKMTDSQQPQNKILDFDRDSLPWLDKPWRQIDDYVDSLDPQPADPELLRRNLIHWMRHGYVVLENVIEHELIDAYLADIRDMLADYQNQNVLIHSDILNHRPIHEYPEERVEALAADCDRAHMRIVDFHSYSLAGKKISLHRAVTEFVSHMFLDDVILLQTLTFMRSSEQAAHQDFAYVPSHIPSQLCAAWVALEDISPDSGPLAYIPGSHSGRKFDWGDGIFRTEKSGRTDAEFAAHLHEQGRLNHNEVTTFCPKKGDVLIWHGALSHGGSPINNPELTRKSYVTHYSQASTHFWEYRDRNQTAERRPFNGHHYHVSPLDPENEDLFRNGEDL
jgi:phytanoyl-CoA hydroxylase